jgi:tRNA(adenine34) deaminase
MIKDDQYFMNEALKEAGKAEAKGEVPVGAVIVRDGRIVGRGHNQNILRSDPTAHAEVIALRKASKKLKNHRLAGCTIYVTIEPCPMCAGALVWARIAEVVFGTPDPKAGACGSVMNIVYNKKLNHRMKITGGVLGADCRSLIQDFFKKRRRK